MKEIFGTQHLRIYLFIFVFSISSLLSRIAASENMFRDFDSFIESIKKIHNIKSIDEAKDRAKGLVIDKTLDKAINSVDFPKSGDSNLDNTAKKFAKEVLNCTISSIVDGKSIEDIGGFVKGTISKISGNIRDTTINNVVENLNIPSSGDSDLDNATQSFVKGVFGRTEKILREGASVKDVKDHFKDLIDYTGAVGDRVSGMMTEASRQLRGLTKDQNYLKCGNLAEVTGITATQGLKDKIVIKWNAVPGVQRYQVASSEYRDGTGYLFCQPSNEHGHPIYTNAPGGRCDLFWSHYQATTPETELVIPRKSHIEPGKKCYFFVRAGRCCGDWRKTDWSSWSSPVIGWRDCYNLAERGLYCSEDDK